jgi:PAS domain S-box-containing protein
MATPLNWLGLVLSKPHKAWERHYASENTSTRLKLRFLYYLCLSFFILNLPFFIITIIKYLGSDSPQHRHHITLLSELLLQLFYVFCLILISKGFYRVISQVFVYVITILVWVPIFMSKAEPELRQLFHVYIILIIATIPLIISEKRQTILIITILNLGLSVLFHQFYLGHTLANPDYIITMALPIIIIGVLSFFVFSINQKALEQANAEVKAKAEIEICLAENERKYREMNELLPQTIFECNLRGFITYVNKKGLSQFGYTQNDVQSGVNILDTVHPVDKERALQNVGKVITGAPNSGNQYLAIRKDGSTFPVEIYATPIIEEGKPKGMRGVIIDISARIKAEEEKKELDERFEAMIEFLPYVVMVTDYEGRFVVVNQAFCNEFGCTRHEAIGKTAAELGYIIDETVQQLAFEMIQQFGKAENLEARVVKKDGSVGYAYFSTKVVKINNKAMLLSSSVNITQKKLIDHELELHQKHLETLVKDRTEELGALNEELQAANTELFDKNNIIASQNLELKQAIEDLKETQGQLIQSEKMASLGILTAGVAHEINNPLNFIVGGYTILEEYFTENNSLDDPKVAFILNSIKTGVERVTKIVSSLNEFSRGNTSFNEICSVHSILDNCLIMLNNNLLHRIEVQKNYASTELTLLGNSGKLHQVFLNILKNAIQSIDGEGRITITTTETPNIVMVEISDTGMGIEPNIMHRILDPFFTTKDPGHGTGLGLSITYSIIKEHHGDLKFESEPGKGTKVTINFTTTSFSE